MRILILEPLDYPPEAMEILQSLGEVRCPDEGMIVPSDYDALIVRLSFEITDEFMRLFPNLKYIVSATTGLDHIDLEAAEQRGIQVLSLRGETEFLQTIPATAELTWGLILALTRNIPAAAESVRRGEWNRYAYKGTDLRGKTLGIVGYGRVGKQVDGFAQAAGMSVCVCDPKDDPGYKAVFEYLLCVSDIITIHVPLNDETRSMFRPRQFWTMKPGAYLVNTSRGEVIDEGALLSALASGHLAGAALDVVCNERGERNPKLIEYARAHDNLIITPHIGGCTYESMAAAEVFMAHKLAEAVGG